MFTNIGKCGIISLMKMNRKPWMLSNGCNYITRNIRRGLAAAVLILFSLFPVFSSHIVADESIPEDVLGELARAVGEATYGRGDIDFNASSYVEEDFEDGNTRASFLLSFSGKEVLVEFYGDGRENLLSSLDESVRSILFYEESLYSDSGFTLGYVLDSSYSLLSESSIRRGTRLRAVDNLGRTRGLFEVSDNYSGAVTLEPVYLDDPYPGMRLDPEGEWKLSGSLSTGFNFSSPELFGMISLGRSDLIYPFVPIVSFAYRYSGGQSDVYGGIGLEAYMNLSRLFPSVNFTLLQEGRIGGSVSVLVGGGTGGFDWRSVFSIFYEHRALPSFFWRLGYQNLQGTHMLVLGFGGDF